MKITLLALTAVVGLAVAAPIALADGVAHQPKHKVMKHKRLALHVKLPCKHPVIVKGMPKCPVVR